MGSKKRSKARANDPAIREKAAKFATPNGNQAVPAGGGLLAGPLAVTPSATTNPQGQGSGWGVGSQNGQVAATGKWPTVNPFNTPKASGLNVISQTYPSNYFVEWNISTHRIAADRVVKQGFTPDWATLVSWTFESSPFVQSLFRTIEMAINSVDYFCTTKKGEIMEDWTSEILNKPWQYELREHIAHAFFWGFTGLNMDPLAGQIYKYPMQDIDPINRFLRQNTYSFWDGTFFDSHPNLLYVQPRTSQESFLGWMQAISRMFVQMNANDVSWVAAGRKLAFPIFTIGYPEGSGNKDALGREINPYRDEAELIARDIGPGSAIVFPFIRNNMNPAEIQKNIEVQFEQTGASQKAHSIYLDFNDDKKNEIREMILGGTLTADVGDSGSRALGEVQERKLRKFLAPIIRYVVSYLDSEYKKKILLYYKNPPKDMIIVPDEAQKWTIEEIVAWSGVLQASGKRFTGIFFEKNGLDPEFIEDQPEPVPPEDKAQPLSKKNDGRPQNLGAEKKNYRITQ